MICYICHKHTTSSFSHKGIGFGYCEEHFEILQKGVAKFIISGNMDFINEKKAKFHDKTNQPTYEEDYDD
jgi:uncharacterized membrane protein